MANRSRGQGRGRYFYSDTSSPSSEETQRYMGRGRGQYSASSHPFNMAAQQSSSRGRGPNTQGLPPACEGGLQRNACSSRSVPVLPRSERITMSSDLQLNDNMPKCTIDEATKSWLNQLKFVWGLWKKSPGVTNTLHQYFESAPNPYRAALFVMANSGDAHQAKTSSLAFTVMDEFCMWVVPRQDGLKHCLTTDVKHEAFNAVVSQRNTNLVKMVVNAYDMTSDNLVFLEPIRVLLSKKQYREACQSASYLKLHEHFSVEDILVPLVFQDKMNVTEDFMTNSPGHQLELVTYLDRLLGKRNVRSEADSIICRLNIPEVKKEKLYHKTLSKLVARLVKSYNLPPDVCPNLNKKRREGALQFLIHKRYIDNTLGVESFREMVMETISSDPSMPEELMVSCASAGDPQEALYWAQKLSVPKHLWPYIVKELAATQVTNIPSISSTSLPGAGTEDNSESWDNDLKDDTYQYHPFPLSLRDITMVDSQATFQKFLDSLQSVYMVGLDSEWKPHFGTQASELALIQISTGNHIYMLDAIALGPSYTHQWQHLATNLFNNRHILKLGFSLSSDLSKMRSSLPDLANISQKGCSYLDFSSLWRRLVKEYGFMFPYRGNDTNTGESLSRLVELTLGKRLDKSEQFSNWERRPLRDKQKVYAALDAHCLIQVYYVLEACCVQQNIPFHEMCQEIMSNAKLKKDNRSPREVFQMANTTCDPSPHATPTSARNVRVVCDTMIQGLGKQLRMCGVDTEILENGQHYEQCARIAGRDERFIVTKGKHHQTLMQYVPQGWCYPVMSENLDEQLEEVVSYFNIIVTKEDVFTRCQVCNSGELEQVTTEVMTQLVTNASATVNQATAQLAGLRMVPAGYEDDRSHHDPTTMMGDDWLSDEELSDEEGHAMPNSRPPPAVEVRPINVETCHTKYGVKVQVGAIPEGVLHEIKTFYVCLHCGKCYWDGSHFNRFLTSIKHVMKG